MIQLTNVKEKKKISTKEWKKKVDSCLHFLEAGSLQLRKPGGRSLKYFCVYVCQHLQLSLLPPLQHMRLGSSREPLHSCKQCWPTAQPAPHSLCHCLVTGPARAERLSVTTFHLLYYNAVQKDVPGTCL